MKGSNSLSTIVLKNYLKSLIKGLNNNLAEIYNGAEINLNQLGIAYSGLTSKSADDFGSGKPYITYMNVYKNSVVDEENIAYVKIVEGETQNMIKYGDVIFTASSETPAEVGMSAVYLGNSPELYLNSFCIGFRLHNFDILLPHYLPYLFSTQTFRQLALPFAQGSTRYNLSKSDFLHKKFKVPTIENQLKIVTILTALSNKLKIEKDIFSAYRRQKEYLLLRLFI